MANPEHRSQNQHQLLSTHRRRVFGVALVFAALVLGGWLGYTAIEAKASLEETRGNAQRAKHEILKGNVAGAEEWADKARSSAQTAYDATHSLPWDLVRVVPWVGSPFETGRQIADVVLSLAADVLQPATHVAEAVSPDKLLSANGHIDLQLLRTSAPQLTKISTAAATLNAHAEAIPTPAYLASIQDARVALQLQVSQLSQLISNTALAARLAPAMMGADGPRSYFMGFQTNAEARGTGGLLGGFGILRFDNGATNVETLGQNVELDKSFRAIDLGGEYTSRYGFAKPSTDVRNSNLSPHFPYAAQIWQSMWEQQSGTKVDGVMSIDPVALSYILGAIGEVAMPSGEKITRDNIVELTESSVYSRFADDTTARKAYLQDVASAVVKRMSGPLPSPRKLMDALGKAASEGRIAVWSSSQDEQQLLEGTPLAHTVPDDPAPYASLVINNLGGNKLDYYLSRQIQYLAGACDKDTRRSTVIARLANSTPDRAMPDYVAGADGLRGLPLDVPRGTNWTSVSLFATTGATLTGAFIDGSKTTIFKGTERGHPVFEVEVPVPRGSTIEVRFELTEPTSPGAPRVPIQPLVDSVAPLISVPECVR